MLRSKLLTHFLLLLCLCCPLLACSSPPAEQAATPDEATQETPEEPREPAQFRDGFESGDTSSWDGEGDAPDVEDGDGETSEGGPSAQ